jgi:hypothetical protein
MRAFMLAGAPTSIRKRSQLDLIMEPAKRAIDAIWSAPAESRLVGTATALWMIGSIQSGVAQRLPPHSKSVARSAGLVYLPNRTLGLTPGFMLTPTPRVERRDPAMQRGQYRERCTVTSGPPVARRLLSIVLCAFDRRRRTARGSRMDALCKFP